ncbi:MAG: polynucleotide adenylyltransferase PcnB [Kiritimatiellia bacterium]
MFFFSRKPHVIIVNRENHCLSRRDIDPDALKVLYRLSSLNHEAYLVGGSVRDLLLGRSPKDFDVGTDARPTEIRKIFRNCFLIGKRFRLAHIVFGKKVIETATFRKTPDATAVADEHGLYQFEDNTYGTPEEDARRRDFTVNGLFYDIRTFSIIDWVDGLRDLKAHVIRSIGDPAIRFQEDPVRMMRAVRFAAKLDFEICSADARAIRKYAPALANASISRLCEEIQRLFVKGTTERSIRLAYSHGLLHALLPSLAAWLDQGSNRQKSLWATLHALDTAAKDFDPTSAVSFAALYWPMVAQELETSGKKASDHYARRTVAEEILEPAVRKYKLPRAVWMTAVDVIELAPRFGMVPRANGARDVRFAGHGIFPEALMFAKVLALLTPSQTMHFDAWSQLASDATPVITDETGEEIQRPKPNPHARRMRRPRGRKPSGIQPNAEAESPLSLNK